MHPKSLFLTTFTLVALAMPAIAQVRPVQPRADHPNLRAALHELREARRELNESREVFPPGHKERAMAALGDGIESIRTILEVKDVDDFRGVERNPEYYKRFTDHPRLRVALEDLRQARDELRGATSNFRGMKERTMEDIDVAVGEIITLMRVSARTLRPR